MSNLGYCKKHGDTNNTLHISIKVQGAGASLQRWVAQSWNGTVIINQPRINYGGGYCYPGTFKVNVGSL